MPHSIDQKSTSMSPQLAFVASAHVPLHYSVMILHHRSRFKLKPSMEKMAGMGWDKSLQSPCLWETSRYLLNMASSQLKSKLHTYLYKTCYRLMEFGCLMLRFHLLLFLMVALSRRRTSPTGNTTVRL